MIDLKIKSAWSAFGPMSPDGSSLTLGTAHDAIQLGDLANNTPISTLDNCGIQFPRLAFSPNSRYLACMGANLECPSLFLWDTHSGKQLWKSTECGTVVSKVSFSEDSRWVTNTSSLKDSESALGVIWHVGTGKALLSLK